MKRPRIALATCSSLRPEEHDDDALRAAFVDAGCEIVEPCWDSPDFDWANCDATLIRTTWDYTTRLEEFLAWADRVDALGTLLNPASVVRWNSEKRYLRELERIGVPCIPTLWVGADEPFDRAACRDWLAEQGNPDRLFIKPNVGATASGTLRTTVDAAGMDQAERHIDMLLRSGHWALIQPYLVSVEAPAPQVIEQSSPNWSGQSPPRERTNGERSSIVVDGEVTHSVVKLPVPGDWRVQDDWGGTDARYHCDSVERQLVESTLSALAKALSPIVPHTTLPLPYARVDWLLDGDDTPRLVELELIEPSLFLRHAPHAADRLARAIMRRLPQAASASFSPKP